MRNVSASGFKSSHLYDLLGFRFQNARSDSKFGLHCVCVRQNVLSVVLSVFALYPNAGVCCRSCTTRPIPSEFRNRQETVRQGYVRDSVRTPADLSCRKKREYELKNKNDGHTTRWCFQYIELLACSAPNEQAGGACTVYWVVKCLAQHRKNKEHKHGIINRWTNYTTSQPGC